MVCARKSWSAGAAFRGDWSLREVMLVGAEATDLQETRPVGRSFSSDMAVVNHYCRACQPRKPSNTFTVLMPTSATA
jgi:hypothetical protein